MPGVTPPRSIPFWLRMIVTFIIPIAVATTVPVQALRGELQWWEVLGFLALGVGAVFLSSRVWKAGVRRYSGASS